jgi:hypothetical protein
MAQNELNYGKFTESVFKNTTITCAERGDKIGHL